MPLSVPACCGVSDNSARLNSAAARMDRSHHSPSSRSNALLLLVLLLASAPEAEAAGPTPLGIPLWAASDLACPALDTPGVIPANLGRECFTTIDKYFHFVLTAGALRL